jgi:hypothetical protein
MAATFFNVPIAPPPHVILRPVEVLFVDSVSYETTTPDLLHGLASSPSSGSGILPQPIYPPPSSSGSGDGKTTRPQTQTTPAPSPSPAPAPTTQPDQSSTESWVNRMRRRYGIGGN